MKAFTAVDLSNIAHHLVHAARPQRRAHGIRNGLRRLNVSGAHVLLLRVVTVHFAALAARRAPGRPVRHGSAVCFRRTRP
eukprot:13064-Chlamydomonas_euryale.AAC.2